MNTAQWYRLLLEKEVTIVDSENNSLEYIKCRSELAFSQNQLGAKLESHQA